MSDEKTITSTALALPSLDYLLGCRENALHDLELTALNRAANCLSRARRAWEEATAQREAAGVARWLIENRSRIMEAGSRTVEVKAEFPVELTITANKKGLDVGPETPKKEK